MSAAAWGLAAAGGLLVVFAAAMPWLDRTFQVQQARRDYDRAIRALEGRESACGTTDGRGDLWPGFGASTAPSEPACGCWVHHLNAADLEAAINQIATHLNLTEGEQP